MSGINSDWHASHAIVSNCSAALTSWHSAKTHSQTGMYKNSSGDEIANVNFFYNIAHVEASAYAH